MLIDWTSSANKSSVISSMIASMDSVWLTTAVQMICVERTPSRRVDSHAATSRASRRRGIATTKRTLGQHLLHTEGDVDEFEALGPLEAVLDDGLFYFSIESFQVLVRLPGLDLEITQRPVRKSTSKSGAPDNSSLSHFSARTRPP